MCGIAGILNIKAQTKELRDKALKMAQKIRHRGPDWSGIYEVEVRFWHTNAFQLSTRKVEGSLCTLPTGNKYLP